MLLNSMYFFTEEVLGSYVGRNTVSWVRIFVFFLFPSRTRPKRTSGRKRFPINPFRFMIHPLSSHSLLNNLRYKSSETDLHNDAEIKLFGRKDPGHADAPPPLLRCEVSPSWVWVLCRFCIERRKRAGIAFRWIYFKLQKILNIFIFFLFRNSTHRPPPPPPPNAVVEAVWVRSGWVCVV